MNHQVYTHLQIQKLVYYCHAWMLAIYDKSLIRQEVCAWEYGPVIEDLYHALKKYGKDQVQVIPRIRREQCSPEEEGTIEAVLKQYGGLSGIHLSSLTHSEGSPWHQTVQKNRGRSAAIPQELIQAYYKDEYDRYVAELEELDGARRR
jgi:uncharacterized phage-associated protein